MKHPAFILFSCIVLLTGVLQESCNLKMIDDVECADFKVSFSYVKDTSPCYPPCEIKFDSKIEGGTARQFDWTFGDGNTSNQEDPTNIYESPGPKPVRFQATSVDGCEASDTTTIAIEDLSAQLPVAKFAPEDTTGTAHFTVKFRNLSSSVTTPEHHWDFGDPGSGANTSTAVEPQHTYEKAGTYTVVLTVTNAIGSSKDTGTVTVKPRTFVQVFDIDATTTFDEKVIVIEEQASGDFKFVMNNTMRTWIAGLTYDGMIEPNPEIVDLGMSYSIQTLEKGKKTMNGYLLLGYARYVDQIPNNFNFYFLELGASFAVNFKSANYFDPQNNGDEFGKGACEINAGGFLLCGNKLSGDSTGIFIAQLNTGYILMKSANLYTDDASNTAYDAIETTANFTLMARIRNNTSGKKETCIVRVDKTSLDSIGTPFFLGEMTPVEFIQTGPSTFIVVANTPTGGRIMTVNGNTGAQEAPQIPVPGVQINAALIDAGGDLVLAGVEGSAPALLKYDLSDGINIWKRNYLTENGISGETICLAQTKDNGYIIGGTSGSKTLVLRTDASGAIE